MLIARGLRFWCGVLLVCCAGCAHQSVPAVDDGRVSFARGTEYRLLPSAVFSEVVNVTQRVELSYKGQVYTFLAQLESDPQGLVMVAMSEFGQTLFSLRYRNDQLETELAPFMPQLPELQYLLGDLQLIYWPLSCWQARVAALGFEVVESRAGRLHRQLKRAGELLVDIEYTGVSDFASDVVYQNLMRGYRLQAVVLHLEKH